MTAPWITYRPALKVLDCTVRDGGLINDHAFEDGFVQAVYDACVAAGIDYMEVGYKASKKLFARDQFGAWKFCDEDDLRRIVGDNPTPLKLAAMADAGKSDWRTDILPKKHSVLGHDPRGLLRPPGPRGGRHDPRRRGEGLRGVGQPDGRLHRDRDRGRSGVGGDLPDAGQRAGGGRQLRRHVRRAGRAAGEEVSGRGEGRGQGGGHPRPQQPATGLRQHDRGDHPRGQLHGRLDGRAGARGRQLPDGTA